MSPHLDKYPLLSLNPETQLGRYKIHLASSFKGSFVLFKSACASYPKLAAGGSHSWLRRGKAMARRLWSGILHFTIHLWVWSKSGARQVYLARDVQLMSRHSPLFMFTWRAYRCLRYLSVSCRVICESASTLQLLPTKSVTYSNNGFLTAGGLKTIYWLAFTQPRLSFRMQAKRGGFLCRCVTDATGCVYCCHCCQAFSSSWN